MEIKTRIKFMEGYLPTKRHRKLRYKECESIEEVIIEEITKEQTKLKFKVENAEIREYNGKLYSKVNMRQNLFYCGNSNRNEDNETIIGRLKYSFIGYSSYFGFEPEDRKEKMLDNAQRDANSYILIDSELWEITNTPSYNLLTFGFGNNHADIGTSLHVVYTTYNNGIRFDANEREKAITEALKTALNRRDTDSLGQIKSCPTIEIY